MSKHRFEAKELWLQRQEKLKRGIVDEETQSVMETCLSTKRPPERNLKNLTYFIKDNNYEDREYDEEQGEGETEDQLALSDLQHENENIREERSKPERVISKPEKVEKAEKPKSKPTVAEEGDDFIKKVNQSLKEAREFIGKIERYPSISKGKDPEKTLKAIESLEKENKPKSSSVTRPKSAKPVKTATTSSLKGSLKGAQSSQQALSSSENKKPDSLPSTLKLENNQANSTENMQNEPEVEEDENKEDQEDIGHYFKSLNQIEDTIKFLEQNIIGFTNTEKEEEQHNRNEESSRKGLSRNDLFDTAEKLSSQKVLHRNDLFDTDEKLPTQPKDLDYSPIRISDRREIPSQMESTPDVSANKYEKHDLSPHKEATPEKEEVY